MQIEFREFKEKYFPLKLIDLSRLYPNIKTTKDGNLIKTISFSVKSNWNIWKQNLKLEIEYQVNLSHQFPNHILHIIDWAAEIQSVSVIVYITYNCKSNAKSLNSFLNTSMISEQQKLQIAEQLIEIASILELSDIQHRNIKLNNFILIDNKTYLTDFGSARTHYNHYTKQSANSEERQKQNETLFYSSPEIMEILTQDNIDFQENEWAQIFQNEQYKKVILKRNDNWSISIILLQLLSFQTQIPDDIKSFYGYDIAKFDQEIRKQATNPYFRVITEIIKQLSFGKISALTCLEQLKKQIPRSDTENKQHKQIMKEDYNILNLQLKRQIQINTKLDYYYLSQAQLTQLQQVNDQDAQKNDQTKQNKTNAKPQQYEIKKQQELNQVKEPVNDCKSYFLDENSIQIFSPKNNEEEQFGNGILKQLCDYESSSFEEQKLIKVNHVSLSSFNNNDQTLLLTQLNDDNHIKDQNKQKQIKAQNYDQQKPSQLQVLTDDKEQVQKKDQIKTVSHLLNNQKKQYTLNQIVDQKSSKSPIVLGQTQYQFPVQQTVIKNISNVQELETYKNNESSYSPKFQVDQQQRQINIIPLNQSTQIIKKVEPKAEELPKLSHVIEIINNSNSPQIVKTQNSNSFHQIQIPKNQQELNQVFQTNLILYQQDFPFEEQNSQKDQMSQSIIEFNKDPQFQTATQIQDFDLCTSRKQRENTNTGQNHFINDLNLIEMKESQQISILKDYNEKKDFNNQELIQIQNPLQLNEESSQIVKNQQNEIYIMEQVNSNSQSSNGDCPQIIQIAKLQQDQNNSLNQDENCNGPNKVLQLVKDQPGEASEIFDNDSKKLDNYQTDNLLKIEVLKLLNSQQLFKYQELLLKKKHSKQDNEEEIDKQLQTIEQIQNIKEKLNYTREQELILLNQEELNQMNEQQLDRYILNLQNILENSDQTQKDNDPSQGEIEICLQNVIKAKKKLVQIQERENNEENHVNQKFQNFILQPNQNNFLSKQDFEDLSYPQQIQYCNIVQQMINLELKIQKGYLNQQYQQQQKVVNGFKKAQEMVLTRSLINFNGFETSQKIEGKKQNNGLTIVNPLRQSSVTDEIAPFLMQDFESQQQLFNRVSTKSPPNSKSGYTDKYNFQKCLENLKDFEIWSTNPRIKKFQKWKRFSQPNFEIPIEYRVLSDYQNNRKKIENQQFEYGGYTQNNQAHGFGIMMKRLKGAIYEGIFEKGKFIYGIALELNNESRLQKYIGSYNTDYDIKHGQCKMTWYDEVRNSQFQIYEEHSGLMIYGLLHGEGKRWNVKERWLYIGFWKKSVRSGVGKYYVKKENEELELKYQGEFCNDTYHGKGQFYHNDHIYEEGEYRNGKKIGPHLLYKDNVLQKTINY
ncbi:unnamed protein product (macronuclear) [Paramecium tetraurelia]|uniref:Protein kinase domain-containing protein n=1 Tax=Paramecium tetraurelia TaxID=5888 RepID=A0DVM8_PARTE|nr:uncharacterized protein GSPATT00020748001 [Paramecium tetraurelia]CAK87095.1 unnamed protein product [Paramecium tetraurelia]|eukprot:XP_001454492.1 hypothetical protein (macronuclear) [Paramecium tetraurelia strain d4-2]